MTRTWTAARPWLQAIAWGARLVWGDHMLRFIVVVVFGPVLVSPIGGLFGISLVRTLGLAQMAFIAWFGVKLIHEVLQTPLQRTVRGLRGSANAKGDRTLVRIEDDGVAVLVAFIPRADTVAVPGRRARTFSCDVLVARRDARGEFEVERERVFFDARGLGFSRDVGHLDVTAVRRERRKQGSARQASTIPMPPHVAELLKAYDMRSRSGINTARKRLAMRLHPDRGGDLALFQEVNSALDRHEAVL